MAFYKKKRLNKGPNKNEAKAARSQRAEDQLRIAGVVGARLPGVKRVNLKVTFLDARKNTLDDKAMNLGPTDPAVFTAPCPGRCGKGVFDFSRKLSDLAAAAVPAADFSISCAEPLYTEPGPCGCEAACRVELEYYPVAPKPPAPPAS